MASNEMDFETTSGYEEQPRYERDRRSESPPGRDTNDDRRRSASPAGGDYPPKNDAPRREGEEESLNTGSNLFVTGINPIITEEELTQLFRKYGEVEKCQIMRDPHTKESRGFGFVNMLTSEEADAAKEALHNLDVEGRTLSVEKARRSRPRPPTPGRYFGPPKRDGGRRDRLDDRRRGGYGRDPYRDGGYRDGGYRDGGYRDDPYRYRNGPDRGYDRERRYGGGDREYRSDRRGYGGDRGGDRGGYRDDYDYGRERYGGGAGGAGGRGPGGRDDRRGGYDRGGYERDGPRGPPREPRDARDGGRDGREPREPRYDGPRGPRDAYGAPPPPPYAGGAPRGGRY